MKKLLTISVFSLFLTNQAADKNVCILDEDLGCKYYYYIDENNEIKSFYEIKEKIINNKKKQMEHNNPGIIRYLDSNSNEAEFINKYLNLNASLTIVNIYQDELYGPDDLLYLSGIIQIYFETLKDILKKNDVNLTGKEDIDELVKKFKQKYYECLKSIKYELISNF